MSNKFSMDSFKESLQKHLNDEIEKKIEIELDEVKKNIEKRVRTITGKIAAQMFQYFEFDVNQSRLIISVDFKNLDKE